MNDRELRQPATRLPFTLIVLGFLAIPVLWLWQVLSGIGAGGGLGNTSYNYTLMTIFVLAVLSGIVPAILGVVGVRRARSIRRQNSNARVESAASVWVIIFGVFLAVASGAVTSDYAHRGLENEIEHAYRTSLPLTDRESASVEQVTEHLRDFAERSLASVGIDPTSMSNVEVDSSSSCSLGNLDDGVEVRFTATAPYVVDDEGLWQEARKLGDPYEQYAELFYAPILRSWKDQGVNADISGQGKNSSVEITRFSAAAGSKNEFVDGGWLSLDIGKPEVNVDFSSVCVRAPESAQPTP
ncbi:hypothetical protein [Mycetocola saprophilus]|uniref:hypothetical protein n=1 Tax=Mycetocola saprophilus TaxID=76636 RepID=UPI003BF262AB